MPPSSRSLAAALLALVLAPGALRAEPEGGPPMLTDDPGTPGDGKWEINLAAAYAHAGDTATLQLPLLDLNYGVGERVQLNFQVPWVVQHAPGERHQSGTGNSLVGIKWRFFDGGDDGWQMSTYPHVQSRFPAARRELSDGGVAYLLPLEFAHRIGAAAAVNFEVGRWLRPASQRDTWIAGVVLGRELRAGFELLAELHDEHDVHSARHELTLDVGTRCDFSERWTLLASAGTDLRDSLGEKSSALLYLGMQLKL